MKKLTVYIADDHSLFAKALSDVVISFDFVSTVEVVNNGLELLKLMQKKVPDSVIVDYEMPILNGRETVKKIVSKYREVKVISLTMHDELELVKEMLDLGVHGFLTKSCEPEELEQALRNTHLLDFYNNELMYRALKVTTNSSSLENKENISLREREVLELICEELTTMEIADRLNLSDKTIQNHRQSLLRKLNVRNTAGLVKKAIQLDIYRLKE